MLAIGKSLAVISRAAVIALDESRSRDVVLIDHLTPRTKFLELRSVREQSHSTRNQRLLLKKKPPGQIYYIKNAKGSNVSFLMKSPAFFISLDDTPERSGLPFHRCFFSSLSLSLFLLHTWMCLLPVIRACCCRILFSFTVFDFSKIVHLPYCLAARGDRRVLSAARRQYRSASRYKLPGAIASQACILLNPQGLG